MRRAIYAVIIATSFQAGTVLAAGSFDGQWKGKSHSERAGGCPTEEMTLNIADGAITGERILPGGSPGNIAGHVAPDGKVTGNHGRLTGEFSGDKATVIYHTDEVKCPDHTFSLDKVK